MWRRIQSAAALRSRLRIASIRARWAAAMRRRACGRRSMMIARPGSTSCTSGSLARTKTGLAEAAPTARKNRPTSATASWAGSRGWSKARAIRSSSRSSPALRRSAAAPAMAGSTASSASQTSAKQASCRLSASRSPSPTAATVGRLT